MYEIFSTIFAAILIFLLPGLSLVRAFHLKLQNPFETLFYSIALGFAITVAVGFILGNTVGITSDSVLFTYLVASIPGLFYQVRKLQSIVVKCENPWQKIIRLCKTIGWKTALSALSVVAITGFNWSSSIGTHGIDMGEHVYWAKVIMTTSRMPNYYIVEPLDQAVKFTYGAHLMLAQLFLTAALPIEEYSWIPPLIGSIALWIGVALLAQRITDSRWGGLIAAGIYGTAYQPGAYIERGNLPDIAGYLLLVATLYSILRVRKDKSFSYALGLTTVSVIPFHQLATVMLPVIIIFSIIFSCFRSRTELFETLRSIFSNPSHKIFWVAMLLLGIAYASTVSYVSGSAVSQLITGNWRPYVVPLYQDLIIPGAALGILGAAGLLLNLARKSLQYMLLFGWMATLIFLANALLIGIPIADPDRFLWRLTEPLSILAATSSLFIFKRLRMRWESPRTLRLRWKRLDWGLFVGAFLVVALVGVHVESILSTPSHYQPVEVFYQDDKRIGQWLASNASSTSVIVNDADVDQTATWIEPYSMKTHFLFRADFAAIVAPANYIDIYKSTAILYESPSDCRVPTIIQRYNISYVIAHTDEIKLFSMSPFFQHNPVFVYGGSAVFVSRPGHC